ncbi:MAG: sn-glycerol-3-phosphate ABC transporter ATP-binding protein UgpC [Rhodobacteraceae bacterium]|jgi:alpha-glucoside transport system ATP-binding protein|nr:sn-glycerol-3-phosphate ABC transporter ATP-binding protein UgpC [Paracoccaceae bacterium]
MANLNIQGVAKSYGQVEVMSGINLKIADGELVVFVGPSGCGKSTLLRMIAGLEDISEGTISIGGNVVNDVNPSERGVAMVFQSYALYPHMTVFGNMAFSLQQAGRPKEEIIKRVNAAAVSLQITELLERHPRNLSGGQQQRVAIGRAIVRKPEVFLFDEPLSNLDAALRSQTRVEIAELHSRLGTTMIYVTHDQVEALTLADKIVVLNKGNVEQFGAPMDLYHRPANKFVAGFIGSPQMNFFNDQNVISAAQDTLDKPLKDIVTVGIRPEHLTPAHKDEAIVFGTVRLVEKFGEYDLVYLSSDTERDFIAKLVPDHVSAKRGARHGFAANVEHLHFFDTLGAAIAERNA